MDGTRTVKTNGSTIHHYTLNGSQIVTETWTTKSSSGAETPNHFLVYLYDENGAPVGLQYRNKSDAKNVFYTYYFEKNLQGDIIAIYTENGTKIGSYTYDAWGNCTSSYHVIIGLYRNSKDEYFLVRRIYSTYSSSDYNPNWAIITGLRSKQATILLCTEKYSMKEKLSWREAYRLIGFVCVSVSWKRYFMLPRMKEKKKNQYDEICSRHGDSELWPVLDKVKEVYTAMEILPFVFAPLMAKGVMLFVLNDFLPLNQAYRFVAFILLYIIFVPFFEELVHLSLVAKFNSLSKRCNRARKNNSDTV